MQIYTRVLLFSYRGCDCFQVARHSHAALEWKGNMIIFGGELANGSLANDVWMYRPLNDDWQQLGFSSSRGAPKLANHAAAVVDVYLYVFGGEFDAKRSPCALIGASLCTSLEFILSAYVSGRTEEDMFSSSLYRFGLLGSGQWEAIHPTGGKPPATAGHSMVFHSPSRTLLVYGGHRPTTARYVMLISMLAHKENMCLYLGINFVCPTLFFKQILVLINVHLISDLLRFSVRVNNTDVFHVDRRFWTSFRSRFPATGPRERAFHSATVIGNYMVVYGGNPENELYFIWEKKKHYFCLIRIFSPSHSPPGGNVHIHYQEEKCYDEEIFFYHLGCHQWVSVGERWSLSEFWAAPSIAPITHR